MIRAKIVNAVNSGIMRAIRDHYSFARTSCYYGEQRSPWNAPEYMFTVYICQEIRRIKNPPYVNVEDPVEAAIQDAGGWGRGRIPEDMRPTGKFDIVLSDGTRTHTPFAIIEVKLASAPNEVWDDATRICRALSRRNRIRCGMLALVVPGQSEGSVGLLKSRIESFREAVPTYAHKWKVNCSVRKTEEDQNGRRYAAMVFKIFDRHS